MWWMNPGNVGSLVYNTTWTQLLGVAVDDLFMGLEWGSVLELANYYTLDHVSNAVVHIRSIPADGHYAGDYVSDVHNNALVWEAHIPAPGDAHTPGAATGPNDAASSGRFIVSGLNLFDTTTKDVRAEPQAKHAFKTLVDYGLQLTIGIHSHRNTNGLSFGSATNSRQPIIRESYFSEEPAPKLCPSIESFCPSGAEAACKAVANSGTVTTCNGNYAIVSPVDVNHNSSGLMPLTLDAVHVFLEPIDARGNNTQLRGIIYNSSSTRTSTGSLQPGSLVAIGPAVQPFLNWSFTDNGIPVGDPLWVRLPVQKATTLERGGVYWVGLLLSEDAICYGETTAHTNPPAGAGAADAYIAQPFGNGAPQNGLAWFHGVGTMSAYATYV
jgi:hypothetical protein